MKKIFFLLLIFVILTGCQKKKENYNLPLSDKEIEECLNFGKDNFSLSYTEFTENWAVNLGYDYGKGRAILITPFLKVALIGKKAAENNEKVDIDMVEKILAKENDKISFEVTLFGNYPQFGRTVKAKLKYKDKEFSPIYCFFPKFSQMARDYTQIVTGKIVFPKDDIPDDAQISLIVSFKPFESEKEETCTFDFDLKKLK